ncbi:MAG: Gfo/Idh/MocA family oxidoreductase [Planctomycetota bacterium]
MPTTDRRTFLKHATRALGTLALVPDLSLAAPRFARGAKLDVALIGAGRQGRAILGELAKLEPASIVAVSDIVESRLSSGLRRVQGAEGFADYREMLERKKPAAVFVATPSHLHVEPCLAALAAGAHVYCEGPLATTVADCQAIAQAARTAGRKFQTGMQGRSNPIYQLARGFLRSGAIRDVVSLRAQFHKKTSWRMTASDPADEAALNWRLDPAVSTGLLGEQGTHQFDVVHWFLDAYPTSVRGAASIQLHADGRTLADTVACELLFPGERRLRYEATLANSFDGTYELFHGTMGAIKLAWTAGWLFKEADAPTQGWEVYANRQQFANEQGITLIADATQLAAQGRLKEGVGLPEPPLYYAIADFLAAVLEDRPVPCPAEEGKRAAVVGILAEQAVRTGETIPLDPALFLANE